MYTDFYSTFTPFTFFFAFFFVAETPSFYWLLVIAREGPLIS